MNRKRNATVILFTFSLLVLVVLQGYYLYNSYRLEEKELNRQAKIIAEKTQQMIEDSETSISEDKLVGDFEKLKKGITIQKEKITHPEKLYRSEAAYSRKLEELLKQNTGNSGFQIAMRNEIYSVFDDIRKQELLPEKRSIILYRTLKDMDRPMVVQEGKWTSRQTNKDTDRNVNERNYYLVKSKLTFQLLNIRSLVFKKIIPLMIISLLIIILIITLFYKSIRNLSRQEQKTAQLHTTIDSIAHELNTPITTLKFSVAQSADPAARALLERQIRRLENIVSSIHTYEGGDVLMNESDLTAYFSEVRKRFDAVIFKVHIVFSANNFLSRRDFGQIMDNLIDNSSKYGADEIEISVMMNKNIEIEVSDNGTGIPEKEKPYIFDKYYRITRNENRHISGLGVGLFLVKNIVDKHKGHISVCSRDKGVSFNITMPYEA